MSRSSDRRCSCANDDGSADGTLGLIESRSTLARAHKPTQAPASLQPNRLVNITLHCVWHNISIWLAFTHRDVSRVKTAETKAGWGFRMRCASCQSSNQREFTAEMMIHFSGHRSIDNPGIPAFPKVAICLNCGFSWFTVPKTDLAVIAAGYRDCDRQLHRKDDSQERRTPLGTPR